MLRCALSVRESAHESPKGSEASINLLHSETDKKKTDGIFNTSRRMDVVYAAVVIVCGVGLMWIHQVRGMLSSVADDSRPVAAQAPAVDRNAERDPTALPPPPSYSEVVLD